ncbi:hypothetical protein, partial [Clostridium fessum]|uniref:hypothetical protein n=1 Tax=Clostridium fessum TaxID=2126740 RepID=UPI0022E2719E
IFLATSVTKKLDHNNISIFHFGYFLGTFFCNPLQYTIFEISKMERKLKCEASHGKSRDRLIVFLKVHPTFEEVHSGSDACHPKANSCNPIHSIFVTQNSTFL